MLIRVLCAVDSDPTRQRLQRLLEGCRFCVTSATGGGRLRDVIDEGDADIVVVDHRLLPHAAGRWIASVRRLPENPDVVVLCDREDPKRRAALLRDGCLAVLYEGLTDAELRGTLQALIERRREEALRLLKAGGPQSRVALDDFISESPSMQEFMRVARRIVDSDSSLLILGETGTGKERLARAIHEEGPRGAGPFLAVNCGALPETLLESELFGHERGAFTGADRARRGFFEQASGGTIFLDEIGEVPLHLQVKLLRVLEDRRVRRLGSERALPIEVRIMAATNRDLEQEVRAKRFRSDLYYRLAVVTLTLPPLRERREDIPSLVESYVEQFRLMLGRNVRGVRPDAMSALCAYGWPGNVRELINVAERAVLLSAGPEIRSEDLPRSITEAPGGEGARDPRVASAPRIHDGAGTRITESIREARRDAIARFEKSYLEELLGSTSGSIKESARRAGINERSLYDLMKRHGLRKESFRRR